MDGESRKYLSNLTKSTNYISTIRTTKRNHSFIFSFLYKHKQEQYLAPLTSIKEIKIFSTQFQLYEILRPAPLANYFPNADSSKIISNYSPDKFFKSDTSD